MKVKYKDLKPLGMRKPPLPTIFLRYNVLRFGDYIVITTCLNKAGMMFSWLSLPLCFDEKIKRKYLTKQ